MSTNSVLRPDGPLCISDKPDWNSVNCLTFSRFWRRRPWCRQSARPARAPWGRCARGSAAWRTWGRGGLGAAPTERRRTPKRTSSRTWSCASCPRCRGRGRPGEKEGRWFVTHHASENGAPDIVLILCIQCYQVASSTCWHWMHRIKTTSGAPFSGPGLSLNFFDQWITA